jgi:hypothetical protein
MRTRWRLIVGLVSALVMGCDDAGGEGGGGTTDQDTAPPDGEGTTSGATGDVEADEGGVTAPTCEAEEDFYGRGWPEVFAACATCHVAGGVSGGTRFVLQPATVPDAVHYNFGEVARASRGLLEGGRPLLLLKPTNEIGHGGGQVVEPGSARHAILEETVARLRDTAQTEGCDFGGAVGGDVGLLTLEDTLRKASLQLAGRAPTEDELGEVRAEGEEGLERVLVAMMAGPAFDDRLKELFNDLLLTDAQRFETGYNMAGGSVPDELRAYTACDPTIWQNFTERTDTPESRLCIGASEALAREPLEMIAHVVRENRPFGEILTAQYRYLNADTATLFGLDMSPFQGYENNPTFFAEVRFPAMHGPSGLPEEYAGIVTTNSFMYRYNSTSTNRNRSRAHHYYKFFQDRDVMKSAARLDLSSVDLTTSPWLNDPQCTSCHASIDPVAGAFQHWTNCYDIHEIKYYETRYCGGDWFPADDMFQPGVGTGEENALAPDEIPTALAALGEHTVNTPDFARAIAAHTLTALTGHPRLSAPRDPASSDYAALNSAYLRQRASIDALAESFAASGLNFKALVVEIVMSAEFRAVSSTSQNDLSLFAMGGGSLTPPEVLHRKLITLVGAPWASQNALDGSAHSLADPPFNLTSLARFRIFAGGIDSRNVQTRARLPSSINAAVLQRMALEMACQYTAYDFALPPDQRALFPLVDRSLAPSGNPTAPDQAPILDALIHLHSLLLGETLSPSSPELLATYDLLYGLHQDGVARIGGGESSGTLQEPCDARAHFATGEMLPQNLQFSDDDQYIVRAWQGVLAYLLMDYRFTFEQ